MRPDEELAKAWRSLKAGLIAVAPRLQETYDGAPFFMPWDRCILPRIRQMEEALERLDYYDDEVDYETP